MELKCNENVACLAGLAQPGSGSRGSAGYPASWSAGWTGSGWAWLAWIACLGLVSPIPRAAVHPPARPTCALVAALAVLVGLGPLVVNGGRQRSNERARQRDERQPLDAEVVIAAKMVTVTDAHVASVLSASQLATGAGTVPIFGGGRRRPVRVDHGPRLATSPLRGFTLCRASVP